MQLDPAAAAAGVRLIVHDALGSTNAEALSLARGGERGPLWIVARSQTAGRGRRGRKWVSEPGNLYATLLITHAGSPAVTAQLSFVAALAVHDAVTSLAPGLPLAFKWPNDVLGHGRKLCGILLEGEGATSVAIGIGINCAHHPRDAEFPATSLNAEGVPATPDEVFRALSGAMVSRLDQWRAGANFGATRSDWLARAAGMGQAVNVRLHGREAVGIFETIDAAGQLLLRGRDGSLETIAAGDVFPMPASAESA